MVVQDKVTGKMYDPQEEFDNFFSQPEVTEQMVRMKNHDYEQMVRMKNHDYEQLVLNMYFGGMSIKEITYEIGIPVDEVKNIISYMSSAEN
jgi:DNA-directed RNA polymerase specialized sigma24 family protein